MVWSGDVVHQSCSDSLRKFLISINGGWEMRIVRSGVVVVIGVMVTIIKGEVPL